MKKVLLLFGALLLASCAGRGRNMILSMPDQEIHFAFARDQISPKDFLFLNQSVRYLRNHPDKMVIVEGHADAVGSSDFNLELGDRRAREVKHFLITNGVMPEQIVVVSYGESCPKDERNYALNRRAVIKMAQHFNGGVQ